MLREIVNIKVVICLRTWMQLTTLFSLQGYKQFIMALILNPNSPQSLFNLSIIIIFNFPSNGNLSQSFNYFDLEIRVVFKV